MHSQLLHGTGERSKVCPARALRAPCARPAQQYSPIGIGAPQWGFHPSSLASGASTACPPAVNRTSWRHRMSASAPRTPARCGLSDVTFITPTLSSFILVAAPACQCSSTHFRHVAAARFPCHTPSRHAGAHGHPSGGPVSQPRRSNPTRACAARQLGLRHVGCAVLCGGGRRDVC